MAKRKFVVETFMQMGDDRDVVHRTPGKRQRRTSDVIDSMGESPLFSPAASTSSSYYSGGPSTPTSSIGVVTPHRPTHTSTLSPDLGYYTPEMVRPQGSCTPEWYYSQPVSTSSGSQPATQRLSQHASQGSFQQASQRDTSVSRQPSAMFEQSERLEVVDDANGVSASVYGRMSVHRDSDHYNMQHRNRGRCVVFNHEHFDAGFQQRTGSSSDARRIEDTFQRLGFAVEICNDYEHKAIREKINELSEEDHSENDCLCIFVLTHGMAHDLICAKDAAYKSENIWKPFTADRCRTLAGKPKLFFFQACRGENLDGGVQLYKVEVPRTEPDSFHDCQSYKIPTLADFLIAYSTPQGFYSWRDTVEGTWYIRSLCEILNEHAESKDLVKMLTMVARKVATEYSSNHDIDPSLNDQKQIPSVTSMLIRDLYFTRRAE